MIIEVRLKNHANKPRSGNIHSQTRRDRIAQMVITRIERVNLKKSEFITKTIRGSGGFGRREFEMRGHIEHTQMSVKEPERYSKQILVKNIGGVGQKKFKSSKVLVIGLGGLGSPVVTHLSSSGIGKIGLVDNDKVGFIKFTKAIHSQCRYSWPK